MNNLTEILVVISKLEEQIENLIQSQPISDEVKQKLAELIKDHGDTRFRHGIGLVSEFSQFGRRSFESLQSEEDQVDKFFAHFK